MDPIRYEAVAERVHLDQRRHFTGVAEVVGVLATRDRWTGVWLRCKEPRLCPPLQPVAQEGEREPREIAATADTSDHDVRHRAGPSPLARAGLRRQPLGALGLVVEGLGHRRVRLVRSGRADSLVLVVDLRRGLELPLQPSRAHQRRRPPQPQRLLDRLRDVDVALLGNLLLDQLHGEQWREILRADRLTGSRVKRWAPRKWEVRLDVVPARRHLSLVEHDPVGDFGRANAHGFLPPVVRIVSVVLLPPVLAWTAPWCKGPTGPPCSPPWSASCSPSRPRSTRPVATRARIRSLTSSGSEQASPPCGIDGTTGATTSRSGLGTAPSRSCSSAITIRSGPRARWRGCRSRSTVIASAARGSMK